MRIGASCQENRLEVIEAFKTVVGGRLRVFRWMRYSPTIAKDSANRIFVRNEKGRAIIMKKTMGWVMRLLRVISKTRSVRL